MITVTSEVSHMIRVHVTPLASCPNYTCTVVYNVAPLLNTCPPSRLFLIIGREHYLTVFVLCISAVTAGVRNAILSRNRKLLLAFGILSHTYAHALQAMYYTL